MTDHDDNRPAVPLHEAIAPIVEACGPKPCTYDPMLMIGTPTGMFHCPGCGEMVIAGMPHPLPIEPSDVTPEDTTPIDELTDRADEWKP